MGRHEAEAMGRHEAEAMGRQTDLVLDASLPKHKNITDFSKCHLPLDFESFHILAAVISTSYLLA